MNVSDKVLNFAARSKYKTGGLGIFRTPWSMMPNAVGKAEFRKAEAAFVRATRFRNDCDGLPTFGEYLVEGPTAPIRNRVKNG